MTLQVDDRGFPILLDDSAQGEPPDQTPAPSPQEFARRRDAVREAAREFETFSDQDVQDWLRGKTNRKLTTAEIASFRQDVRTQQVDDLVDILDQAHRGSRRTRRTVRVQAPRGYVRKTLNALADTEMREVLERLKARGWEDDHVASLVNKLPEARRSVAEGLDDSSDIAWTSIEHQALEAHHKEAAEASLKLAQDLVTTIMENLPQPQITVDVPVTLPGAKGVVKRVVRDERGLISHIEEDAG